MSTNIKRIEVIVAKSAKIEITEFPGGTMLLEKRENGRWFVTTKYYDGKYYLQENLADGEIREISVKDNLPEALSAIAWAN